MTNLSDESRRKLTDAIASAKRTVNWDVANAKEGAMYTEDEEWFTRTQRELSKTAGEPVYPLLRVAGTLLHKANLGDYARDRRLSIDTVHPQTQLTEYWLRKSDVERAIADLGIPIGIGRLEELMAE